MNAFFKKLCLRCGLVLLYGFAHALTINSVTLPRATQYMPYTAEALSVTGGTLPYSWTITNALSTLPEGMTLDPNSGVISSSAVGGQGEYLFQVKVQDGMGSTATSTLTIKVNGDSRLGGCSIFPPNTIFHQRVDALPVDTSPAAPIYSGYQSSHLRVFFGATPYPYPNGIPFLRVPYNQTPASMAFTLYGDESDAPAGWSNNYLTTYPFPANAPVESTSNAVGGDNHVLILQTAGGGQPCKLWEVWQGVRNGDGTWSASNGAYWDLSSNALRTKGWTSADAAGLPIMPLTVNYDEVASATVTHPIRFTVNHMLNGYVWPARHTAGVGYCSGSSGTIPAGSELSQAAPPVSCSMTGPAGQIYRLTSSAYATARAKCPSSTHPQANTIITTMRQYGIILADNGLTGGLIGTPDARWQDSDLECLTNITLSEFEPVNVSSLRVSADSGGVASNLPICTLTAAPDSIRRGGSSMLTASCSPAASTYTWTGGTCAGVSLSTCNVALGVSTSYTVTGTNSSGTSNPASAIVSLKVLDLTPILMLLLD